MLAPVPVLASCAPEIVTRSPVTLTLRLSGAKLAASTATSHLSPLEVTLSEHIMSEEEEEEECSLVILGQFLCWAGGRAQSGSPGL